MPASRILEGSLPEQQPKGPDFFWRPTTTQNGARAGYQGQSPWLVRGGVGRFRLDEKTLLRLVAPSLP